MTPGTTLSNPKLLQESAQRQSLDLDLIQVSKLSRLSPFNLVLASSKWCLVHVHQLPVEQYSNRIYFAY